MGVNKASLNKFADLLPRKARTERDVIIKSDLKKWDKSVRENFGRAIDKWFSQHLVENSKEYVYVEGWNPIPKDFRGPSFFGAKMYPDAALIIPSKQFKIAIDLDHGNKGSQIETL